MGIRGHVARSWHKAGTVVANLFLLNLLWIICSIPIVTIIPSSMALFDTIRRWTINGEEGVIGTYFSGLRRHFWRSYLVGIPTAGVALLLYVEISFYSTSHSRLSILMLAICLGFALAFLSILVYLAPLFVSLKLSVLSIAKLAFTLGMRKCFVSIVSVFPIWFIVVCLIDVLKISLFLGIVPVAIWLHYIVTRKVIQALEQGIGEQFIYNYTL